MPRAFLVMYILLTAFSYIFLFKINRFPLMSILIRKNLKDYISASRDHLAFLHIWLDINMFLTLCIRFRCFKSHQIRCHSATPDNLCRQKGTPCIAMSKHLIWTTSLLTGGSCRVWTLSAHVASARTRTHTHPLTPPFEAVPPTTLSRALPLHHTNAVQSHISNGAAALWTEILCRCVCVSVFFSLHICVSFAVGIMSLVYVLLNLSEKINLIFLPYLYRDIFFSVIPQWTVWPVQHLANRNSWQGLTQESSDCKWRQEWRENSQKLWWWG